MEFHELLEQWSKHTGQAVMATVVAVEGHAYRKEGASMLVFEDGRRIGGISPGCLETDLIERVAGLLTSQASQVVEYDMHNVDDFSWGEAVGCGGSIRVLLEPVRGELLKILSELLLLLDGGERIAFTRSWGHAGDMLYSLNVNPEMIKSNKNRDNQQISARWSQSERSSFVLVCEPKPRLIILGAGADAEPVAELANKVGFRVVVSDWRDSLCCSGKFVGCEVVVGTPIEAVDRLSVGDTDYVIIMSHQLQRDRQYLDALWSLHPRYTALLGSEKRASQLLDGRVPPQWMRWPVGLPIKAEGSLEIAVSVVAELIAVRRGAGLAAAGSLGSEADVSLTLSSANRLEANRDGRGGHEPESGSKGDLLGGRWKPAYGGAQAKDSAWKQRHGGWIGD